MARKLRIEFAGAIYHVLNRGNYRRDLFQSPGEAEAFVGALEETARNYSWRIHAYVLMRNHYHIALQTPEPNLIDGMHWLQSTFATRFNRFHRERGHLFQGRYQALLVENETYLVRLVDYIHLNPVRAGVVPPEQVMAFRWSSLGRFVRGNRFQGLEAKHWLQAMGLSDDGDGWSTYVERLRRLGLDPAEQERLGFGEMAHGWTIGTEGWRKAVAKDHAQLALHAGLAASEARVLREARWSERLEQLLAETGRTEDEMRREAKSASWKIALAVRLRSEVGAAVKWIAAALHMGSPNAVRGYLSNARRSKPPN